MRSIIRAPRVRGLTVAAAFTTALLAFNPASAAVDADAAPRVTVRFGDLDLSKPQGAETLYRRIRFAAEQVCAPFDGPALYSWVHFHACVDKAIADAVRTVDKPAVLAVYKAKHPGCQRCSSSRGES
jgi:UrcA family protein